MMVRGVNRTSKALSQVLLLNDSLKLGDLDSILVLHACQLSQMSILEDCMSLSKEVIDQKSQLVSGPHHFRLLPVCIDKGIYTRWHRIISQVRLIFIMELTVHHDSTLAWSSKTPLRLLRRVLLAHEAWRVLSQPHEARPIHLSRDAVGAHGLLSRNVVMSTLLTASHRGVQVVLGVVPGGRVLCVRDDA